MLKKLESFRLEQGYRLTKPPPVTQLGLAHSPIQKKKEMHLTLIQEVLAGLASNPPYIAPKFFYDELGSKLFEAITLLDEYYPTRVEKSVMQLYKKEIANVGFGCDVLIDLGAGNCAKASALFESINPKKYRALDISKEFLEMALADLQKQFPNIEMDLQVCDLNEQLHLPDLVNACKLFFYPGSSIGNFDPKKANRFLQNIATLCDGKGGLLIGVDLEKDVNVLNNAYNDSLGVTAAFNLNVLNHVNRVIHSNFVLSNWEHYAVFNKSQSRIEMYLRALQDVEIDWPNGSRHFEAGDLIHTENSYKYTKASFTEMLRNAGFKKIHTWTDAQDYFLVCYASAEF
jgi:dimethylhistidine N-methyltransferase